MKISWSYQFKLISVQVLYSYAFLHKNTHGVNCQGIGHILCQGFLAKVHFEDCPCIVHACLGRNSVTLPSLYMYSGVYTRVVSTGMPATFGDASMGGGVDLPMCLCMHST